MASAGRLASLPLNVGMEQKAQGAMTLADLQIGAAVDHGRPGYGAGQGLLGIAQQGVAAEGALAAGPPRSGLMKGTISIRRQRDQQPIDAGHFRHDAHAVRWAMQPATIRSWPGRFCRRQFPQGGQESSSAASRKPQVLTSSTSASSGSAVPP